MKKNRTLWLMAAIVMIPLLAISCGKSNSRGGDDDESGSSKSKKEKTEKKIKGGYTVELDVTDLNSKDAEGMNGKMEFYFDFKNENDFSISAEARPSQYIPDIDNTISMEMKLEGGGEWEYDKKEKVLKLDFDASKASFDLQDVEFEKSTAETEQVLQLFRQNKQQFMRLFGMTDDAMKTAFMQNSVFTDVTFTKEGFTAVTKKGAKITFKKD